MVAEHLKGLRSYFQGTVVVGGPQIIIEGKEAFNNLREIDVACVGKGSMPYGNSAMFGSREGP